MATDKDLLTTTAEWHIQVSATVVDRVTSSEAVNRHPNPIRYSITASSFVQLYCSCPLLNALFWMFLCLNSCLNVFFPPFFAQWSEDPLLRMLHQKRSARVRMVHSVFSCVVRRRSVQAVRHRWLSCGPSGASQLYGDTGLFKPPGGAAQSGSGWLGNPFVLWLCLCSYIYKNAAVILCAAV